MKYCENCKRLVDSCEKCWQCETKNIREPMENDEVYLTTKDSFFSNWLEDVLKQNNIPCLKKGTFGAAMLLRAGVSNIETYDFFVPFGEYERAKELEEELFTKKAAKEITNIMGSVSDDFRQRLKIWSIILYCTGTLLVGVSVFFVF